MHSTADQAWAADAAAQLRPPKHWTFGPMHVEDALVSPDEWPLPEDGIAQEVPLAA